MFKILSIRQRFRRVTITDLVMFGVKVALIALLAVGAYRSLATTAYTQSQWLSFVMFGVTTGSIYALVALGYTMVFGILRLINFCHGDIFMFGCFSAYFVAAFLDQTGWLNSYPVASMLVLLASAALVSCGLAVFVERIAYRPFRNVRSLAPLICAIGMSFLLQQTARGFFGSTIKAYPQPTWLSGNAEIFAYPIPKIQIFVLLVALSTMALLYIVVMYTKLGVAMRALSEDRDAATLMGIDINRVILFTFALGGAVAGIAGVLYGLVFVQVHFFIGFVPGIKAFSAAVLGGIGNIPGAMVGGILIGIAESVGPALIFEGLGIPAPYQLRDVIAFTILVGILIYRPSGIFGERVQKRA